MVYKIKICDWLSCTLPVSQDELLGLPSPLSNFQPCPVLLSWWQVGCMLRSRQDSECCGVDVGEQP